LSRPRALVTGADGFTGRRLTGLLDACGYDVFALSRRGGAPDAAAPGRVFAPLDDAARLDRAIGGARADIVFHLAGEARTFGFDEAAYRAANVDATRALLAALARAGASPRAVVLMSSAAVYGRPPADGLVRAGAPLRPTSAYGRSKRAMEAEAARFADALPIILARPFNYAGPGQSEAFVAGRIAAEAARGAHRITLGDPTPRREFNDVDAVCRSLIALAGAPAAIGAAIDIASGRALAVGDLVAAAAGLLGRPIGIDVDPARVRADDPPLIIGDPSPLARLGAALAQPPIEDTMAAMLAACGVIVSVTEKGR